MPVTKLMQIFSRQAVMMDALISHFIEMRRIKDDGESTENPTEDGILVIEIYLLIKIFF